MNPAVQRMNLLQPFVQKQQIIGEMPVAHKSLSERAACCSKALQDLRFGVGRPVAPLRQKGHNILLPVGIQVIAEPFAVK